MKLTEVRRILHPTDLSRGSDVAFIHALKLALVMKAELEIMHVDSHPERTPWESFPSVRETLHRWRVLPAQASEEDVAGLGISVYKAAVGGSNPLAAIVEHMQRRPADMVVLASHHRLGLDRWLHQDVAGQIPRLTKKLTLFVPHDAKAFVAMKDGGVNLERILIPFAVEPEPQPAIDAVEQLVNLFSDEPVSCQLLHMGGSAANLPPPQVPPDSRVYWETSFQEGEIVSGVLDAAADQGASLIALTTQGQHGFLDALRGSTAEQILRAAPCSLLAVPWE